ncbi:ubiquitin carboxyl-terminal hydrolase 5 [Nilaparvata lugens]|uniref:ubiquitin carboxyl-terminal hydrolase 5 n=1 Tax=Nilaparvata lugens TaxID=108931 RepID=UPI00193E235E|nr:ubiquitin carboxyl-terminal hydrolase 5 [Nilaparvata lugens]
MGDEFLEALSKHIGRVKIPQAHDKIYKDECVYSFDSPESDTGLYVCLNSFLGFGRDHVERYHKKTGNSVFLHIKRVKIDVTPKIQGDGPEKKVTRLAIGLEGGFTSDTERKYEVKEALSVVVLPQHLSAPYPSATLPEMLTMAVEGVLSCESAFRVAEKEAMMGQWDGEARIVTKHANNLLQLDNDKKIPPSGWKCEKCDLDNNLWLNLTDGTILCGRKFFDGSGGNNHASEHYKEAGYPLAVKLGTITKEGVGDVYSYDEDDMVEDPNLIKHLAHWGINISQMEKTDKSMVELELDLNQRVGEWATLQENCSQLKPVYGAGHTGIINLGNSCYVSSLMQVIFCVPDFVKRFVDDASAIYDSNVQDPASDFNIQMAKLGHGLLSGKYSQKPPETSEEDRVVRPQGIAPIMFKTLVGKGHPDFSTKKQQDVLEFLLHFITILQYAVPQSDDESSMSGMSDGSNDFFVSETDDNSSHDSYISDLSWKYQKISRKKLSDFEVPLTATTDSNSDSEEDETNTLNDWNETSAGGNDFDTNLFSNTDNFNDGPETPTPPECEKAEKKKKKKKTDNFNDNSGYRPSSNERKPTAKPTLPLHSPFVKNSVKKKIIRVQWSKEEMDILNAFFAEEIILGKRPPTKKRCEELINKHPQFQGRGNYLKIKWRVNAIIQERRKKLFDFSQQVRPHIKLSSCFDVFTQVENVEQFYSTALKDKTTAHKTTRLSTLPDYLFLHLKKFTLLPDWTPVKLDVSVEMPEEVDLSALRGAGGLQPGEEALAEESAETVKVNIDENMLAMLVDMGFPTEAAKKAIFFTEGRGLEAATEWIMQHIGDDDFQAPFVPPGLNKASDKGFVANEDSVTTIMAMGFTRPQAVKALKSTDNQLERACDWIFSHQMEVDEPEPMEQAGATNPNEEKFRDGGSKYRLVALISHMGTSTMVGHYVCHILKNGSWVIFNDEKVALSENPPKDLGYVYLYERIQS